MDISRNKKILNEAIFYGCKTVSDLAYFLRKDTKSNTFHKKVNQSIVS